MLNRLAPASLALTLLAAAAASAGPHMMPFRDATSSARALAQAAASSGPHLNYYGGPVLANVKVVAVFWGPNVNSTVVSRIGDFYGAFAQSPMYDWLSEYNTNITPQGGGTGTNQTIGHGSFAGGFTITPSHTGSSLQDADIQAELNAQIAAGHLPKPDANTLYMTHFPPGVSITNGSASSCVSGGFCAYHGTTSQNLYYGVMPDMGPTSGCFVGCGSSGSQFDNQTSVCSHEMVEATTDAAVGLATSYGPPLGWYDPQGSDGEIGDICNAQQGTFTSANGTTYTVQKEWSNSMNACITAYGDNFSISVSPGSASISAGSSASFTVSTATVHGSAQTVKLVASALPSGVSATFSPSTVTSGQSAKMTVSVSSSAQNGTSTFQVQGSGTSVSHAADVQLTVSGGSGGGGCPSGTVQVGGVCVPGGGCNTGGFGAEWAAAIAGVLALARRRRN